MSFTDRYDLEEPLGRHPGGIVWRATRKTDGRTIAVAIADGQGLMDEGLFELLRERFRSDLEALKKAKRGHLPTVHEVGEDDAANPYAAMELVEGKALAIDEDRSLDALGKILDGVLRALEAAHRVRVFHGDIEPGNVRVAEDGSATLVGFGLNRALAGREGWADDDEEHVKRSAVHRAPELGEGELPSDARADLYGVGVLLHVALTGEPPEEGRSVTVVGPELGASMVKLIDRAVDPSPQGRYASAWAMRTALSGAIRMAAKGEKPPSGKKTMAGGLKAPDVPKVPKVPEVPLPSKASRPPPRPSSPPPSPKQNAKASVPPPAPKQKAKASVPPPAPKQKAKASVPPPAPKASKGPKTKPFPIRPEPQGSEAEAPPTPKKVKKGERPKTVPFEIPSNAELEGDALVAAAADTGAGAASSIPPPVVGVGVDARDSAEPRENTESISLADVEVMSSSGSARSAPPPAPKGSEDAEDELPLTVAPPFLRSPAGLAVVALVALGLGWGFGRLTAPEPIADSNELAAAPAQEGPEPEADAPEPAPVADGPAEPIEAAPPEPEPLRLGELPEGVEALFGGAPYDPDAPPTLAPAGDPLSVVVQRGEQRVRLSLARDAEGALALNVDEVSELPAAEPTAAPSPMTRRARRRRRATMRSGGSLMRPGIAYDPGF